MATLHRLATQGVDEVVVADGGSDDGTPALARREGVRVVDALRGIGTQQNRVAAATMGDVPHAGYWLDPGALATPRRILATHPRISGGCFQMRVEADALRFRAVDAAAYLRAGFLGAPSGDQRIFVTRRVFEYVRGFPRDHVDEGCDPLDEPAPAGSHRAVACLHPRFTRAMAAARDSPPDSSQWLSYPPGRSENPSSCPAALLSPRTLIQDAGVTNFSGGEIRDLAR